MAGGMTHGTKSMPRHLRCPLAGMLCTKCATMKPIKALNTTAVMAKMHDCLTTSQNVCRLNSKVKLLSPTKRSIDLLSVARCSEYRAGYKANNAVGKINGNAMKQATVDLHCIALRKPAREREPAI